MQPYNGDLKFPEVLVENSTDSKSKDESNDDKVEGTTINVVWRAFGKQCPMLINC